MMTYIFKKLAKTIAAGFLCATVICGSVFSIESIDETGLPTTYYKYALAQQETGSGNILAYATNDDGKPIIVELTSGSASLLQRDNELAQHHHEPIEVYTLTALDVVMLCMSNSGNIIDTAHKNIKRLNWPYVSEFIDSLHEQKNRNKDLYAISSIKTALIKYIDTVIDIMTPYAISSKEHRGKFKNAPIVIELTYGDKMKNWLMQIDCLKEDDINKLSILLQYVFIPRLSSDLIPRELASLSKECLNWLIRALHTEVQFAVLKQSYISENLKMLRPCGDRVLSKLNPCISCAQTPFVWQSANKGQFFYLRPDDWLSTNTRNQLYTDYNGSETKKNKIINQYKTGEVFLHTWKSLEESAQNDAAALAQRHGLQRIREETSTP